MSNTSKNVKVALAGRVPSDPDYNGLDAQAKNLIENPEKPIFMVAIAKARSITDNIDTGRTTVMLEVTRIEPLGWYDEVSDLQKKLLLDAAEERTGKEPLPYEQAEIVHEGDDL